MALKSVITATALLGLGLTAAAQVSSSTLCDIPDAAAASVHYDGGWKISITDPESGKVTTQLNDCSAPVRFTALDSTRLSREGGNGQLVSVADVDGATVMWIDEKGQALATKPLNGSFMLMRYGFGNARSDYRQGEYQQVLRYDRCPVAGSTCACEADAAP